MPPAITRLMRNAPDYPGLLEVYLGEDAPQEIQAAGALEILPTRKIGIFSSRACPGPVATLAYDAAQHLRDAGVTTAGGFHSPMEKHCLDILLRSPHPVILAPARGLESLRLAPAYRRALDENRLLLLSPFPGTIRRADAETARERNRFLAALCDAVFIPFAEEDSATLRLAHELLRWGKPVATLDHPGNQPLIAAGVPARAPELIPRLI